MACDPKKHHYIPAFYLKRWAGEDDRVCQYSRPFRNVVPKRQHPNATGYVDRLYELRGFPMELAQQVESSFFRAVDSLAAEALGALEAGSTLTIGQRSAWSRFIISLLLRCPEDIQMMRQSWSLILRSSTPEAESAYAQVRSEDSPATFSDYLANLPDREVEQSLFEGLSKLIDNMNVGEYFNQMTWNVLCRASTILSGSVNQVVRF